VEAFLQLFQALVHFVEASHELIRLHLRAGLDPNLLNPIVFDVEIGGAPGDGDDQHKQDGAQDRRATALRGWSLLHKRLTIPLNFFHIILSYGS
jgi:hypothetical protein